MLSNIRCFMFVCDNKLAKLQIDALFVSNFVKINPY